MKLLHKQRDSVLIKEVLMSDTSLMISIFAVIIAFTSLVWNIIKQIMNDKHVLRINALGDLLQVQEYPKK